VAARAEAPVTVVNVGLTFAESRTFLARLGLAGEIVPTPGHGPVRPMPDEALV
jgi:hypothetical protein